MLKRSVCILTILMLVLSHGALANTFVTEKFTTDAPLAYNGVFRYEGTVTQVDSSELISFFSVRSIPPFEEYICNCILSGEELPDKITGLDAYNMEKEEFLNNYYRVMLERPELLAMPTPKEIACTTVEGKQIVSGVSPLYLVSNFEAAETARREIAAGIEEYVTLANQYETDLEKLIVIHDKMVADCVYDSRVLDEATRLQVPKTVYHSLGVFRDRFAVCQGYSQALYVIGKEIGIEMDFCVSDIKNHMWNYVKLNGKWYHMDMTNDDPLILDESGKVVAREDSRAYHWYFMISDEALNPEAHGTDWRIDRTNRRYECSDKTYETNHLFNLEIPFTTYKTEDEYYHAPVTVVSEDGDFRAYVDFKSKSLYTGNAVLGSCLAESTYTEKVDGVDVEKTEKDFCVMAYATTDIKNGSMIVRYDNNDVIVGILDGLTIDEDRVSVTKVAQNVPEDMPLSFTSFLWDSVSLSPLAYKSVWSR